MCIGSARPAERTLWWPNLDDPDCADRSVATGRYNCFAFAAGDLTRRWAPLPGYYWPPGVPREETLEAYILAFGTLGFELCQDPTVEDGYAKLALYANADGEPKHAALQLADGQWMSKIGRFEDIRHRTIEGLAGPLYGQPARFLRRLRTGG